MSQMKSNFPSAYSLVWIFVLFFKEKTMPKMIFNNFFE